MAAKDQTVVTVIIEDRADGGIRVYSEDLPSLSLSGSDKAKVFALIGQTIKRLFEMYGLKKVEVQPTRALAIVLALPSPREISVIINHLQSPVATPKNEEKYVVKFAIAA
jgi:hypothetical protein